MTAVTEIERAAHIGSYEVAGNRRVTAGQVNAIAGKPIDDQAADRRTCAADGKTVRADTGAGAVYFYLQHGGIHAGNAVRCGACLRVAVDSDRLVNSCFWRGWGGG